MSKPFIIVYGDPGTGKSTEALTAFQSGLLISSAPNNSHYYEKLFKRGKLPEGARLPKRTKVIDIDLMGATVNDFELLDVKKHLKAYYEDREVEIDDPVTKERKRILKKVRCEISQRAEFEKTVQTVFLKSVEANEKGIALPYENIIVDEWGAFLARAHLEYRAECVVEKNGETKENGREAFQKTGDWALRMSNKLRACVGQGVGVCVVMHGREAEAGKKEGPRAPSANMALQISADSDGILQRIMKDRRDQATGKELPSERLWVAMAKQGSMRKLRGLEPEDEETIGPMRLFDILVQKADFEM